MGVKTYDALEIPDDIRTQLFMNRTRYPLPFAVGRSVRKMERLPLISIHRHESVLKGAELSTAAFFQQKNRKIKIAQEKTS